MLNLTGGRENNQQAGNSSWRRKSVAERNIRRRVAIQYVIVGKD
jgi:hypothetical protein